MLLTKIYSGESITQKFQIFNIVKYILQTFLLLLCINSMTAQTFCLKLETVSNTATELVVSLHVNGSAAFELGSSNLVFEFDNTALSSPVLEQDLLTGPPFYQVSTVTTPQPDNVSYNIELNAEGFGMTMSDPSGWTEVGQIEFTKTGMAFTTPFAWLYNGGTTETVAFIDDEATQIFATSGACLEGITIAELPVEYLYFDAKKQGKTSKIEWETAMEQNNYGFHVQHSTDSRTFKTLGFVEGKGSSSVYEFIHNNPQNGLNYYRLEQEDFDGKTKFSVIKSVLFDENKPSWTLYPNPTSDLITVSLQAGFENSAAVECLIYNQMGQVVQRKSIESGADSFSVNLQSLVSGFYVLELVGEGVLYTEGVVKE